MGTQHHGVPAAIWWGFDRGWRTKKAEEPVFSLPDRTKGSIQSATFLWASRFPAVHRKQNSGCRKQEVTSGNTSWNQVSYLSSYIFTTVTFRDVWQVVFKI